MQDAADLLNHLLRESWQDQIEAQPGIGDTAAVESLLRQREPGAAVLGPKRRELDLGRRHVLAGRWGPS